MRTRRTYSFPADSEFEITGPTVGVLKFPKNAKPEHDLLTLPDEAASKSKKVMTEPAAQAEIPQPPPVPFFRSMLLFRHLNLLLRLLPSRCRRRRLRLRHLHRHLSLNLQLLRRFLCRLLCKFRPLHTFFSNRKARPISILRNNRWRRRLYRRLPAAPLSLSCLRRFNRITRIWNRPPGTRLCNCLRECILPIPSDARCCRLSKSSPTSCSWCYRSVWHAFIPCPHG